MLEKLVIEGGRPLHGDVRISGAKNSALPILASTLLSAEPTILRNVPRLKDVETTVRLLEMIGAKIDWEGTSMHIHCPEIRSIEAPYELVRTMRASVLFLGPLVARANHARISLPGGCAIGARPINLHLHGLARMGCEISLEGGYVDAKTTQLRGSTVYLDNPTVTGTQNIMMAACLAKGTTVIDNAAREPEVVDLADSLIARGARIEGAGTSLIKIEGVDKLGGCDYSIMNDRIEAGTFLTAAAITGGKVRLLGMQRQYLQAVLDKLEECGAILSYGETRMLGAEQALPWIEIDAQRRMRAVDIETQPFPGFATDMQAQFMALLTLAEGTATITENIFENRFMHVSELQRLGANLKIKGNCVFVEGVEQLTGAPMMATDLRASASLVVAALAAKGVSEVRRIYHLDRGYEQMDSKLRALGAHIERHKQ